MDPKKPNPQSPEERVEELTRRRRRESAAWPKSDAADATTAEAADQAQPDAGRAGSADRPRLTEKQRIEARRHRREQRRRRGPSRPNASGNALSRGVRATGTEIRRTVAFLVGAIAAGLDRLGPLPGSIGSGLAGLLRTVGRLLSRLRRVIGSALAAIGAALLTADRVVTPRAAALLVAFVAGALLVVSQFLDFRATEIGQPGYSVVQEITHAPRLDVMSPIDAHSILLLVVAAVALAGIAAVLLTRRRTFGLLVATCGLATIAVTLLVDLPKGLDVSEASISFAGVAAVLLTGFWLQLAAGVVLAATGLGLALMSAKSTTDRVHRTRPRRTPAHRTRASRSRPGSSPTGVSSHSAGSAT